MRVNDVGVAGRQLERHAKRRVGVEEMMKRSSRITAKYIGAASEQQRQNHFNCFVSGGRNKYSAVEGKLSEEVQGRKET